ncbi:nickel transporter [Variovorax paradoxus]|uniref:HoxN/HupN/NixA family nickel/cobalt transporter n=1 Tax=Variovorax paradoxus TaxID=34073 RepID=UPI003ECDCBBA
MSAEWLSFSGLVLMFALGLRHGLDPDHIACIDGLTWRALDRSDRHGHAPWIGTLFALGHGLLVTAIAAGVSQLPHDVHVPETLVAVFDWIPTALLVLVGTMNLRLLRRRDAAFAPAGWKLKLVPQRLRLHASPWAVVLTGVLFATVFDTATQAAAWGYVASHRGGGLSAALAAGLVFTAGMMITDTLDGRLICSIDRRTDGRAAARRYRRVLGWLIVCISYAVAAYNVGKALLPAIELGENAFSLSGLSLVLVMLVVWAWSVGRA